MRSTLYAFMVTAVWFQLTTQQGVQQQQTGQQGNQGQQGVQQVDQYGRPTQQQTQQGNQYGKTIQQQGQQVDQYGQPTQRSVQQGYQYGQATPPGNQFGQNIPNSNQQYNQPSYNQPGSPYTNPQKPGYISMICDMGFVPLSDADIEAMANFEAQGDSQAGDNSQVDGTYNPNTQSTTSNNTGTTTPPSTTGGGTRAINQVTPNSANAAPTTAQSRLNRRSMQNPASTTNQGISSSTATGKNFGTGNGSSNTLDGQAASQTFPNSNSVTTNTMSSNHPGGNFPISNGNGLNTGTSGSSLSDIPTQAACLSSRFKSGGVCDPLTCRGFPVGLNCVATSDDGTSTTGTNTSTNSVVAEVPCQMNYYVPTKEDTDQTMICTDEKGQAFGCQLYRTTRWAACEGCMSLDDPSLASS